jgi:hypothetical protein
MRISRPVLIAVAVVGAALGLLLLMASVSDVRIHAAPLDDQGTGVDPRIDTCTMTAGFPISDTHPGDGVAKTVYFNNQSGGVLTATFGVSGTPTLALIAGAAFDELSTRSYTSSVPQASFVVTYAVAATHTSQFEVIYMAMNGLYNPTSIDINYVRDVVAPVVTVTAPTVTSATSFTVSWEASDPAFGSGVVVSYTVAYREDDGAWEPWLSSTALTESTFLSTTVDHTYAFSVTVYDHVGNQGEGAAITQVGQHYVYLPLVTSDWVWWYQFDIYEPNDRVSQAYPLTFTQPLYEAYIWDATDSDDYYAITPVTTETVQITLTDIPAGADYDLYVYYQSGSQYPLVVKSDRSGEQDENVTFAPTIDRTYYIRVYPYSGFSSTQPYHLTVIYQ